MANKRKIVKHDYSPMFRHFVNLLINRIVVDNLPEEINEKFLLYHVLLFGRILFFKKNGKYHVMWFSGKGTLSEYYIQDKFLVVNPWANSTTGDYDESNACILYSDINAYLDNADVGLFDFCQDYAEIVNSIDSSIRALAKNTKVIGFITGASSSVVNSAKQMVNSLLNSDNCIGICEESLVDSIRVNPIADRMDYKFSELIKARQYYISDFYQKLGIANNQNMKAERLTDNESQLIENVSDVDFNHILDNLNYSAKTINERFGLNISFRLNEVNEDVNNSEETAEDNVGNDPERDEASDSQSGISGEQNVSSGTEQRNSGEENTSMAISDAIRQLVAERVAEMLRGDNNARNVSGDAISTDRSGIKQSTETGDTVSTDRSGDVQSNDSESSVSSGGDIDEENEDVNNSEKEEINKETKDVEIKIEVNVEESDDNDNRESEKTSTDSGVPAEDN